MQWPCTGLGHWIPVATGFLLSGAWPRWGRTALSSPSGHWHDHNVLSVLSYVRHMKSILERDSNIGLTLMMMKVMMMN